MTTNKLTQQQQREVEDLQHRQMVQMAAEANDRERYYDALYLVITAAGERAGFAAGEPPSATALCTVATAVADELGVPVIDAILAAMLVEPTYAIALRANAGQLAQRLHPRPNATPVAHRAFAEFLLSELFAPALHEGSAADA